MKKAGKLLVALWAGLSLSAWAQAPEPGTWSVGAFVGTKWERFSYNDPAGGLLRRNPGRAVYGLDIAHQISRRFRFETGLFRNLYWAPASAFHADQPSASVRTRPDFLPIHIPVRLYGAVFVAEGPRLFFEAGALVGGGRSLPNEPFTAGSETTLPSGLTYQRRDELLRSRVTYADAGLYARLLVARHLSVQVRYGRQFGAPAVLRSTITYRSVGEPAFNEATVTSRGHNQYVAFGLAYPFGKRGTTYWGRPIAPPGRFY